MASDNFLEKIIFPPKNFQNLLQLPKRTQKAVFCLFFDCILYAEKKKDIFWFEC